MYPVIPSIEPKWDDTHFTTMIENNASLFSNIHLIWPAPGALAQLKKKKKALHKAKQYGETVFCYVLLILVWFILSRLMKENRNAAG